MTRTPSPLDRLGSELDAAAARQIAAATAHGAAVAPDPGATRRPAAHAAPRTPRRSHWWTRNTLVAFLVIGLGGAGVAVAATALLRNGNPVPLMRGGKPVAGRSNGAPRPGSVQFLTTSVPDPDGGDPWAMRYWTTDRGYACLQVGRYSSGQVGMIDGPASAPVFHRFQIGTSEDGISGCYPADAAGHARIALHEGTTAGGGLQAACEDGVMAPDGHGHSVPARFPPGCHTATRTIDVGLLGPAARSITVNVDGKSQNITPIGPEGAYFAVQRYVKPLSKLMGFRHKDPKLNVAGDAETWIAMTPAAHTITQVVYDDGTCRVYPTRIESGACLRHTAWATFPPIKAGDVRAPVHVWAIDSKRIGVRFVARVAVTDRRSGYSIAVKPVPRSNGFLVHDYEHDVKAGQTIRLVVSRDAYRRGRFLIQVTFRTAPNRPTLSQIPWQQGPLVGQVYVRVG